MATKASDIRAGGAYVEISGDADKMNRALNLAQTNLRTFGASAASILAKTVGVLGFGALGKAAITSAANMARVNNRYQVLFRETGRASNEWVTQMSKSFGIGETSLKDYLNQFQGMIAPMGFAESQATELSKTFSRLAIDIGAAVGDDPSEAVMRLSRALVGEREGLKRYGISIQEVDIQQEALRMGMGGVTGELTRTQKAYAGMSVLMKRSEQFIGAASRNTDGWGRTLMRLREAWNDILEVIGRPLMRALQPALDYVGRMVRAMRDWLQANPAFIEGLLTIGKRITQIVIAIKGALTGLFAYITAKFTTETDSIYNSILRLANMVSPEFGAAVDDILSKVKATVPMIETMMDDFFQGVTFLGYEMIDKLGIAVKGMIGIAARDALAEAATFASKQAVIAKWAAKDFIRGGMTRAELAERDRQRMAEIQAAGSHSALARMIAPTDADRRAAMGVDATSIYTALRQGAFADMLGRPGEIMAMWGASSSGSGLAPPPSGNYGLPRMNIPGIPTAPGAFEAPTLPAGGVMGFMGARRIGEMMGGNARGIDGQQLDVQRQMLHVLESIRDSDQGAVYA